MLDNMVQAGEQIMQAREEVRETVDLQIQRNRELETRTDDLIAKLDTFKQNLQQTQRDEGEKLIKSLQLDSQRITDIELRVRKVEILSNKIYAIDQSVK